MLAIFKREFKAFFGSVIGYLFIAANLVLTGIYFFAYNLAGAYPYFSYALSSSVFIYLVTIPILTMRLISEDRKNKTDQLILTSPISISKIVIGKFLAVAAIFMILAAIISTYPLIMSLFGSVPYKETYVAVLGFTIFGLTAISIGVFISSVTESQIIAAVLSFVALFINYLLEPLCNMISSTGNWVTEILGALDIFKRFSSLLSGTLDLSSIVYMISVIILMLFLTTQMIQKRRYSVSVKNLKMGAYSTGAIVVFTAVIVFINLLVGKIPERYTIFDMTSNQLYSITEDSKTMLRALDKDVDILIYSTEDNFDASIEELLRRYSGETSHVSVEYVDPVTNPQFAKDYSDSALTMGTIVVKSGDKFRIITENDIYLYEYTMNYETYSYDTNLTGIDAEGQLTSAIAYVTSDESHVVYFTKGHGEPDYETGFTDLITKANVSYSDLTLLTADAVPKDAECIIINAPETDFSQDDIDKLITYMDNGGNAIISLSATAAETPMLYSLLDKYGISASYSLVSDPNRNNHLESGFFMIPEVAYSDYTAPVYDQYYVFTPYSIALNVSDDAADNIEIDELLYTSDDAFAKRISQSISTDAKQDGDTDGPFTVAAVSERTDDAGNTSKLFVTGSAYLFTESASSMVAGGNIKLFTGILNSFVQIENNISIPLKTYDVEFLTLTDAAITLWRDITIFILPAFILAIGIIVWIRRRRK